MAAARRGGTGAGRGGAVEPKALDRGSSSTYSLPHGVWGKGPGGPSTQ